MISPKKCPHPQVGNFILPLTPWKRKFLGFFFYYKKGGVGIRVHAKPLDKFKNRVREILSRSNGLSMEQRIKALNYLIIGWVNYFSLADMKERAKELDEWIRRRLRVWIWKQWRKIRTRHDKLSQLGMDKSKAWEYANTRKGYWRIAGSTFLHCTLTNDYLSRLGFVSLSSRYSQMRSF